MKIYIDLSKAQLHFEHLIKKPIQVKGKDGKVFTRMQWVDPRTGQPASTTYNHPVGGNSLRRKEILDNNKYKVIHVPIDQVSTPYKQDIDRPKMEQIKAKMEQGYKLPPVELDHNLGVQDGHHRYTAAMELGLSHIPAIIRSTDTGKKQEIEKKFKEESQKVYEHTNDGSIDVKTDGSKYQDRISKLSKFIRLHKDRLEGGYSNDNDADAEVVKAALDIINVRLTKEWDATIAPHIEELVDQDPSSSKDARDRQKYLLNTNLRPRFSVQEGLFLHDKDLCKAVNDGIYGEHAEKIRDLIKGATLSINMPSNAPMDSILNSGYKASTLKSYMGDEDYNDFVREHKDDSIEDINDELDNQYGEEISARQVVEHTIMGIHPFDENKPVYVAYNPFNLEKGGAPQYGDQVISVDPKVLHGCTLTTQDSFSYSSSNFDCLPVSKPADMEHLGEIWMYKNHANMLYHIDQQSSDISKDFSNGIEYKYDIQLELQYHAEHESIIEPHLLKKWRE